MARGKLIPKENLFYVIERLGDKATWQNIYDNTIGENGKRYASKIFNKEFLKSKDLPVPKWL